MMMMVVIVVLVGTYWPAMRFEEIEKKYKKGKEKDK